MDVSAKAGHHPTAYPGILAADRMEKTARGSVPVQEGCCPVRAEYKKKRKAAEKKRS